MFVGHFALGFAAKRATPKLSLALLFVACQLADLIWPALVAAGVETVRIAPGVTAFTPLDFVNYPYSHSLVALFLWGSVLGSACWLLGLGGRASLLIAGLVVSHWILDMATHRPDMPLAPGLEARFGLGLWNSRAATFAVEGFLWFGAISLYARATQPSSRATVYVFWSMIVLLTLLWLLSLGGAPPPSLSALAITNSIFFSIVAAWAYWIDRRRKCIHP